MQDQKDGNFMYSGELQPSRFPALLHSLTLKVLQTIGKIKLLLITISFLLMLFSNSCFDEEPDCVCSLEFRMYLVTVIDTLGNPVDSLETTITNSRGKEFNFDELSPPPFMQGAYYVMTDGYQNDFTIRPEKIPFNGIKGEKEVNGEFYFNRDECRCHVYKIAGPDTLILN